ncbi:MAG: transport permease protein [Planctomycetota bacterium]
MEQVIRSGAGQSVLRLLNPLAMAANLWRHRHIARQLARRDIIGRYRSSSLGLLWSIITPLVQLCVYTFIFGVVLGARWGRTDEPMTVFALTMFSGLLVFLMFAEVVNRSPGMVAENPNYVKKVVFPLEMLGPSGLLTALFNFGVGAAVWLLFWFVVNLAPPPWTIVYLPVVLLPLCLFTLGFAWFLGSLGVFVRDLGHVIQLITQVLIYLTPVFFPMSLLEGKWFAQVMQLNPLTHVIEDARRVMMWGQAPNWPWWTFSLVVASLAALLGYAFFMKSKRAFGDVL